MDLTGPAALAGFFVHIPDGTGVGMGQRGGHSSRNMILLKDRKDQEREHKNTRCLYIWVTGKVIESQQAKRRKLPRKIYVESEWYTFQGK